jgi:hypothetical protein
MKPYLVFMTDLGEPLQGRNPRGAKLENFGALADAQSLAESEKNNWDTVLVCKRTKEHGLFDKVERYQKGRKYKISGGA